MLRVFLTATSSSSYGLYNSHNFFLFSLLPTSQYSSYCTNQTNFEIYSLVIATLVKADLFESSPRPPQTLGLFSPYDANIMGGGLIGVGMALTGACPGTVLPQVSAGISSAFPALVGAVLGGVAWSLVGTKIRRQAASAPKPKWSLDGVLGLRKLEAIAAFIGVCATIVCISTFIDEGQSPLIQGLKGGLAIGAAQAGSILLTDNTIGSSAAYEEAGKWVLWLLHGANGSKPPYCSVAFAGGALLGSLLFVVWAQPSNIHLQSNVPISFIAAVFGGACLAFGARLAGGCTSGHGISGMAMLSMASFISVAAMFGGGMVAVRLV